MCGDKIGALHSNYTKKSIFTLIITHPNMSVQRIHSNQTLFSSFWLVTVHHIPMWSCDQQKKKKWNV